MRLNFEKGESEDKDTLIIDFDEYSDMRYILFENIFIEGREYSYRNRRN